jgi:hypothetical protein
MYINWTRHNIPHGTCFDKVLKMPDKTTEAKRRDLKRFAQFFASALNHDHVDGWTPAVTKHFQTSLSQILSAKSGRVLMATSINRIMATLGTSPAGCTSNARY